ncbi:hypothetical protein HK102_013218 [Quaeritorhiza haematococci]|nr:hypothetical protein HK102_013218 [Quaeritorhiza haematococci]
MSTLTIRLIKSFEYRTVKNLVLHDIDLEKMTVGELMQLVQENTFKLYVKAHGSKTTNLVINIEHDDIFMDESKTLAAQGAEHETEISFFNKEAYIAYKAHPETKW